jgi:hypothetical protein
MPERKGMAYGKSHTAFWPVLRLVHRGYDLGLILLCGGVLSIAIGGSSLITTSALLAKWFHRHRAPAVSLSAAGASGGVWCTS